MIGPYVGLALLLAATLLAYHTPNPNLPARISFWGATVLSALLVAGFARLSLTEAHGMSGDSLYAYAFAKNYINGHGSRINPSLGFPGVMDAAFFPSFDFSQRLILRTASWLTDDAIVAYNLMYLVGTVALTACSLAALCAIYVPLPLAMSGAVIYAVSPFFVFRSFNHDFLALSYSVPLGAALGLLIARQTLSDFARSPFTWFALAIIATSGLYYAYFSSMFLSLIALAIAVERRSVEPIAMAMICVAVIVPVLLLTGFGSAALDVIAGRVPQVHRLPYEQLMFGLNTADSVHVYRDIPFVGWIFQYYVSIMPALSGANGLFEWPGPLLTAVILASPVITITLGLSNHETARLQRLAFLCASSLCFGLLYAQRGGLAFYFNLLVAPHIRATARIIPFLSFFAIVLTLVAADALLRGHKYSKLSGLVVVAALFTAALPTVGAFGVKANALAHDKFLSDRIASVRKLLTSKDQASLTAVLQLPALPWSEVGPVRDFHGYSHQIAFVLDKAKSSTRWSYGTAPSQPAYSTVAGMVDDHKSAGLATAARSLGFDGVLIEKAAYSTEEVKMLLGALDGACVIYDDKDRALLNLSTNPDACDQTRRGIE